MSISTHGHIVIYGRKLNGSGHEQVQNLCYKFKLLTGCKHNADMVAGKSS
ncbi:MAG: hypothetical protein ACC657_00380 [Thiohalomonadales bacterium]